MNSPPSLVQWLSHARRWSTSEKLALSTLAFLGLSILTHDPSPVVADLFAMVAYLMLIALLLRMAWQRHCRATTMIGL